MKTAAAFWAFSKAGRALGELHVGYEKVAEYPGVRVSEPKKPGTDRKALYRVEKMRFGRAKDGGGKDKTEIHYNDVITVSGVPLEAYDYVINGKSAIEWVMERQSVTTDKASGIVKDANAWATETVGDPRYPLSLLLRVITVSLETNQIVASLPPLDILEEPAAAPATTPDGPPASDARALLIGFLELASFKDRRATFHSDDGDTLTLVFPEHLDAERHAIEHACPYQGRVRLLVGGEPSRAEGQITKLVVTRFQVLPGP